MEFSNDLVDVSVQYFGGCEVELAVLVKPETCVADYQEALKSVRQEVSFPGFRKGKAPVVTVKKHFGEVIEARWKDHLMNRAAREALALTELYPWSGQGVPQPKVESISLEEGAKFLFRYESEPQTPSFKKEEVKVDTIFPAEVTDEEIDREIETLRKQHATYETIEEPLEEGGFARVDVESLVDAENPTKVIDNHLLEVVKGEAADWLRKLMTGHKAGDVVDGVTAPDDESTEEEKKHFESRPCRVTLLSVEKHIPAEDEVLVSIVKAESFEDLRTKLRERLQMVSKERADQETKQKLWALLFDRYPFELPTSLVAAEEKSSIQLAVDDLRRKGMPESQIVERERELEAQVKIDVAKRLHSLFLSRKIVQEIRQQPTDQELHDRALQLLMWDAVAQGKMAPSNPSPELLENYRHHAFLLMVRERAEHYLLS